MKSIDFTENSLLRKKIIIVNLTQIQQRKIQSNRKKAKGQTVLFWCVKQGFNFFFHFEIIYSND